MRKSFAVLTLLIVAAATNLWAVGEARLTGRVVDPNGQAITGAEIRVESLGTRPFDRTFKSGKDGNFSILLLDGTQQYRFTVSKEGFASYTEEMKLDLLPQKNERTFELADPASAQQPLGAARQAAADPAVVLYNEGVELANTGQTAEAIAKMEEALARKPSMMAAVQALTQLSHRQENWSKVIEYGEQVLEISPDEPQIAAMLADAYDRTGNKAKAGEYRAKAPKNASALFNQAAALINSGKTDAAAPLLVQAIEADAKFAKAHYELGMLYAGQGNNAGARKHLQTYLDLEPNGAEAATAREMLNYVK